MDRLLTRIAGAVRRAPALVVTVVVALTAVLGWVSTQAPEAGATGVESFATDTPAAATQERIAALFGDAASADDRTELAQLVVVQEGGDVLDAEGVALAARLTAQLRSDPTIAGALAGESAGPAIVTWADPVLGAATAAGLPVDVLTDDAVDELQTSALAELGDRAAGVGALLGSSDATATSAEAGMVLVTLDPDAAPATLDAARTAINQLAVDTDGHEVLTFDLEALLAESNADLTTEMGRLLGLAFLLIVLVLVAVYRRPLDVLASLLGLAFAIVWSQGLAVLLGPSFLGWTGPSSELAMAIPILLVGLGVDYGIHLTMRAREEQAAGADADEATTRSVSAVGAALLLATITTVVGFATNVTNPLPPLQDFGVFAAVGVVAAFAVMVTFVPAVRLLAARRRETRDATGAGPAVTTTDEQARPALLGRAAAALAPLAVRRPVAVLVVAGLLTAGAGAAATGLSTEFSQTDFFPEGSRALRTVEAVQEHFGGGLDESTQVLLEPAPDAALLDEYVAGLAGVTDVRTFGGAVTVVPAVSPDGAAALLTVPTTAGEDATALVEDLDGLTAELLAPAGVEASVTSEAVLTGEILVQLRDSQVQGLVVTLLASMLILALAFGVRARAPMLGVLSIASVGVVTVWVLGLMALVGIPFNVMTAMVSSLAIGIGVPFGIHVVNRFLEDRAAHPALEDAVRATLVHTGGALVGSAVTTVLGFGVLVLATIPPMQQFGMVTAVTIALALVSALVVLPAMLTLWARVTDRRTAPSRAPTTERVPAAVG